MSHKPDKKLATAHAAQTAAEKALVLAEAAVRRAHTAKVEFRLTKRTWKLARKAAKRTAKEARRAQKKLAKFATILKKAKQQKTTKPARSKRPRAHTIRKPTRPRIIPKPEPAALELIVLLSTPFEAGN